MNVDYKRATTHPTIKEFIEAFVREDIDKLVNLLILWKKKGRIEYLGSDHSLLIESDYDLRIFISKLGSLSYALNSEDVLKELRAKLPETWDTVFMQINEAITAESAERESEELEALPRNLVLDEAHNMAKPIKDFDRFPKLDDQSTKYLKDFE